MDVSLMTAMMAPASAELPDARAGLKGEDANGLPFELALQTELELLAPLADVALGNGTEAGETSDLTEILTSSDTSTSAEPACSLAILATAESLLQPPTPGTPQLILPPLTPPPAPPLATPPAEESVAPATVAVTSATAASANPVPMAMAQLRPAEPASTGPVERTSEKTFARFTGAAAIPTAAQATKLAETGPQASAPVQAAPAELPPDTPAPTRGRVSETLPEPQAEKPRVRADSAPEIQSPPARLEAERAPVRLEAPLTAEAARAEAPVAPAPAANVSTMPAPTFTTPQVSQHTAPQTPAAVTAHIETPIGHTEWAEQFREKVVWLVDRQQQTAELHIHPRHLGPVEVMLTLNEDRTSIAFVSPHPAVREAIEASFTELRATLEERGLNLGHASVSADARDAREQLPQNAQPGRRFGAGMASAEELPLQRSLLQRGLVDTFA